MPKPRRKKIQTPLVSNADPQATLETMLQRIGKGGKATGVRRAASNLAGLYSNFDVLPLSEAGLLQLLGDPTIERTAIAKLSLFKSMSRWPLINILGLGERESWNKAAQMFLDSSEILSSDALFIGALETDPIQSFPLESLLIAVRTQLLRNPTLLDNDATMRIALAMARQIELNEAIWAISDEDNETLNALSSTNAPATAVLHALYGDFVLADEMASDPSPQSEITRWIADRHTAQTQLSNIDIPTIGAISDTVSLKVAGQYADAPYPRWTSLAVPDKGARLAMARALSTDNRVRRENRPNVLIAGCGTGHHAVASALGYGARATVLGVDLSAPSLAYAASMAKKFSAQNLSFAHMDLLNVRALDQRFDVIETIGVLHHTADPYKSWAALLDVLKPGGLMAVGVYSATARTALSRFRDGLNWNGASPDDDAIRSIRHTILRAPKDDFERSIATSADFHTLSNLRDLLFNIHEIPMTLVDIREFLQNNALAFLRFDAPPAILDQFVEAHGSAALADLESWIAFEAKNPDAFDGMYVFWVQAPPADSDDSTA